MVGEMLVRGAQTMATDDMVRETRTMELELVVASNSV